MGDPTPQEILTDIDKMELLSDLRAASVEELYDMLASEPEEFLRWLVDAGWRDLERQP